MKRFIQWFVVAVSVVVLSGCSTVPIVGRKQMAVPGEYLVGQSLTNYKNVLSESKLSKNKAQVEMVQRAGQRISVAVEEYLRANGMAKEADSYQWEFNLIEDNAPNAWCMPGGKVAFYTGILPFTQDEAGVAVVMGHEIAHAVANHGGERMAQQVAQQGGSALLAWGTKDSDYNEAYMMLYGYGSQYLAILPYSRMHENEADRLGLIFMAMAGYDPNAAAEFWQRMDAAGGEAPPEFMSTHPSNETRIENLQKLVPEAMQYYRPQR